DETAAKKTPGEQDAPAIPPETNPLAGLTLGGGITLGGAPDAPTGKPKPAPPLAEKKKTNPAAENEPKDVYQPRTATKTERLDRLLNFRAVPPLYGVFLLDYLGQAEPHERIQIFESLLEMSGSVARSVRVPWPQDLPPGQMTLEMLDPELLRSGIYTHEEMYPPPPHEQDRPFGEPPRFPITLGEKLHTLFQHKVANPGVSGGFRVHPVWAVGDLLEFNGDFNKFVTARELQTQEGMIFRHVLRLILLCDEFAAVTPPGVTDLAWRSDLREISEILTASCRAVDPQSTDQVLTRGEYYPGRVPRRSCPWGQPTSSGHGSMRRNNVSPPAVPASP
ncbi:MAG: hypothetical protein AAGL98_14735, partial [Planctomycetota bacterium]